VKRPTRRLRPWYSWAYRLTADVAIYTLIFTTHLTFYPKCPDDDLQEGRV